MDGSEGKRWRKLMSLRKDYPRNSDCRSSSRRKVNQFGGGGIHGSEGKEEKIRESGKIDATAACLILKDFLNRNLDADHIQTGDLSG